MEEVYNAQLKQGDKIVVYITESDRYCQLQFTKHCSIHFLEEILKQISPSAKESKKELRLSFEDDCDPMLISATFILMDRLGAEPIQNA